MRFVKVMILAGIISVSFVMARSKEKTHLVYNLPEEPEPTKEIVVGNVFYTYDFWETGSEYIKLIGNFDEKLSTTEISRNNNCIKGINGSFYDENMKPLAWWESNGNMSKDITHNNLLNGFISLSLNGKVQISKVAPIEDVLWGMQAGPVLIANGEAELLILSTDKPDRRSVAGVSLSGNLVGISIYTKNSKFDGPTLAKLPGIVKLISNTENLQITDAINLDGGSASGFISPKTQILELIAVGSWICAYK